MLINLSVALSGDNCMDDNTPQRLVLSTSGDWAEVYRLRGECDAILIGGETLRRDNPSLSPKGEYINNRALRVVVSGRGAIDHELKIFNSEGGDVVIFSNIEREELNSVASVVVSDNIDVFSVVSELESRGVRSLFVEGGAQILRMFLSSGMVNTLRVARNPLITVDDVTAPSFDPSGWIEGAACVEQNLDGMEVATYILSDRGVATEHDRELMERAVEVSRLSPPKESCYRVGAVVETAAGELFEGYTLETSPTHHAEQAAITKALSAGADLRGATMYSTIEPCSQRVSEPKSCSELLVEYGFARAVFALYEPSHFVTCHGAENMRSKGIDVVHMPDYADAVKRINSHILAVAYVKKKD